MTLSSYEAAGVSVERGDQFVARLKHLVKRPGHDKLKAGAGGYAAVYPLTEARWIALTTDGVGTKVLVAHQFGQHHGIGIDLVAMCANDLICVGATPTLFLDYYATGTLNVEMGLALMEGIAAGCDQADMLLVGGETAEMPNVYEGDHYDLAGFAVGDLSPENLITGTTIRPGQRVVGVASSGIHSNGLSLARKLLTEESDLRLLLEPTRIYVRPVLSVLKRHGAAVHGLAHITGGGLRNLFRLNPDVGFDLTHPLPLLPVFEKMLALGLPVEEGFKTFNMGMGLAIIVDESQAQAVADDLAAAGFPAHVVGEVTDARGQVRLPAYSITVTHSTP